MQREYERVRAFAAEREQALTVASAAIEELERALREREADIQRLQGDVETLRADREHAERFSPRRLVRRLRSLSAPDGREIFRYLRERSAPHQGDRI